MKKSSFRVSKMDCSSEEQLIRMSLEPFQEIVRLDCDVPQRRVEVYHNTDPASIDSELKKLNLGSSLLVTEEVEDVARKTEEPKERKMLITILAINFGFFLLEIVAGLLAHSMGLIADSLDMLADAIVYGLSLQAVGRALSSKKRIAKLSGYFQLMLAVMGFAYVLRRFLGFGEAPDFQAMIGISLLALIGNLTSLLLLQRSKNQEVHIQASWIFTSNDVIANIGVIVAGALVYFTNSRYPDLIVGTIIFFLVARGSFAIIRLARG